MELKTMNCKQCGSVLEILPGIDRVKCKACGTMFAITGTIPSRSERSITFDLSDNPIEVKLVQLPANTITFGMNYTGRVVPLFDSDLQRENRLRTADWEKLDQNLSHRLRSLAFFSYATGEEYMLDVGDFAINDTCLYYNAEGPLDPMDIANADNKGMMVEPKKAYHHNNHYYSSGSLIKPQYVNSFNTIYTIEGQERRNQQYISGMNALIRKHHIEYTDEIRYSAPYREGYSKKSLFGKMTQMYRFWVMKYTNRRMYIRFTQKLAQQYLTDEDKATIDKIGQNPCVQDMAGIICSTLRTEAKKQLEKRKQEECYYNVLQDMINVPPTPGLPDLHNVGRYMSRSGSFILYSHYGMGKIERPTHLAFLAANLKKEINTIQEANGDIGWSITYVSASEDNTPYEPRCEVKMVPKIKTVSIYNSWV